MLHLIALIFGAMFLVHKYLQNIIFTKYTIHNEAASKFSELWDVISGLDTSGWCQVQSTNKVPIGLLLQSILDANNIAPISWRAKQDRRKSSTKSDIDGRLACHYFCPRQPSLPDNVDQYGKYGSYTTVICREQNVSAGKKAVADSMLSFVRSPYS